MRHYDKNRVKLAMYKLYNSLKKGILNIYIKPGITRTLFCQFETSLFVSQTICIMKMDSLIALNLFTILVI